MGDLAAAHVQDVFGEGLGEVGLVGGEDDGAGAGGAVDGGYGPGAEVGEELDHVLGAGGVEVGEGLVEEEEFGVGLEDSGEGGALAHALGVLANWTGEVGVEAYGAEGHLGRAYAGAAFVAVERGEVGKVLHGGELVVEHGGVAHVSDAAAFAMWGAGEDGNGSASGCDESGDDAEEGGFAGAVFAEDYGGAAGGEVDRDVSQSGEGAVDAGDRVQGCGWGGGAGWGGGDHCWMRLSVFMRV